MTSPQAFVAPLPLLIPTYRAPHVMRRPRASRTFMRFRPDAVRVPPDDPLVPASILEDPSTATAPSTTTAAFLDVSITPAPESLPLPTDTQPSHSMNTPLYRVDAARVQTDTEENLRGFVKTRGSLDPGAEFVFWWTGDIYDIRDGCESRHLFSFEGFNIGRMIPVHGGWRMLTREVGLYKDPKTNAILDTWTNPYTGHTTDCVHVWNDPVNQEFLLDSSRGPFKVPTTLQGDNLFWHAEIFLKYKSPLTRDEYPAHAHSDTYQSTEMFQFFSSVADLGSDKPSADCLISWVRVGPWLPWMQMGDAPGKLVYHCRGRKLPNGYQDLSESVRTYVAKQHPEYAEAPFNYSTPNETSWTYMKKLLDAKGQPRADGTVACPDLCNEAAVAESEDHNEKGGAVIMNGEQLAKFDGSDEGRPIYLGVGGRIFDVSTARRHYQKGETYNCLTGRDSSHAFISGDLSETGLAEIVDVGRLDEEQRERLDHWVEFFSSNYPEVGKVV